MIEKYDVVSRVKSVCKSRGIAISKLESDLNFGNGYIGKQKNGTITNDRIAMIADYLEVDYMWLSTGIDKDLVNQYSQENEEIVSMVRSDVDLLDALRLYMKLPENKKKHIIETIKILS